MEKSVPLWIRIALLAVLGVGLFWVLASVGEIVALVMIAALLAYIFDPLASLLEARGLGRTQATVVVFAGTSLVLGVLGFLLLPLVVAEVRAIQTGFDMEQARAAIEDVERWLEARLAALGVEDLDILGAIQQFIVTNVDDVLTYVPNVVVLVTQLGIFPFVMFFLLKDGRRIKKGFINLMPNRYFEFTLNVLHKTDVQLGNYLRGQLIASSVVALLSIAALWLLEVDYFVLIGLFAGLTNMIPYLGPVTGATVAALISVVTTGNFDTVLPIIAAFVIIQAIDNVGVSPLVLARNIKLHPLLILLTLILAGKFFGFLGLLLAVPVTAVFKVFVQETVANLRSYRLA
ncbi:MAG: AI-2E family transporter [Bacteroidetes bacterium]|nr:AI-2E family transporter [Bacteroidota bacterium]